MTVVAIAVVLQVCFIVLLAVLGFTDPTEETFAVTLRNDTASLVVLKQCDAGCTSFHSVFRLAPGRTAPVNTSSSRVDNWWLVGDESGRVLGCVDLLFDHKVIGMVVEVSGYGPCPSAWHSDAPQQAAGKGPMFGGKGV